MVVLDRKSLYSFFLILMVFGHFFEDSVRGETLKIHLTALDKTVKVAKGESYKAWTFEGFIPGPVIRVKEGDEIDFIFENKGSIAHSIVLHGVITPPDQNFRSVGPKESVSFTWKAEFPGVFLYHCGTSPTFQHLANGMYGALIVDPTEPRENAREIVLVQSEFYSSPRNVHGMLNGEARFVVFNGYMNKYVETPIEAQPGELIRWYVLNAGPNFFSSFNLVGGMFLKVFENGNPKHIKENVPLWTLPPGGGAIFETRLKEEGVYSFKTHALADSYRGGIGFIRISKEAGPPGALMP
ncbi:MAG TPA: multicopper oxidase domain-containing protein [Nitrospiria bacterium]|jgi:nitrite reductase (NO-forming)